MASFEAYLTGQRSAKRTLHISKYPERTYLSKSTIFTPSSVWTSLISNCSVSGSLSRIHSMASAQASLNFAKSAETVQDRPACKQMQTDPFEFSRRRRRNRYNHYFFRHSRVVGGVSTRLKRQTGYQRWLFESSTTIMVDGAGLNRTLGFSVEMRSN